MSMRDKVNKARQRTYAQDHTRGDDQPPGGIRYFTYAKDHSVVICTVCGALVHRPSVELHTETHKPSQRRTAATERKAGRWQTKED